MICYIISSFLYKVNDSKTPQINILIDYRIEIYPSRSIANLDRIRLPDIPRILIFIILLYSLKRRKAMYRKSHRFMPHCVTFHSVLRERPGRGDCLQRENVLYLHSQANQQVGIGGRQIMKRELGIARCGLACCLCSENVTCNGCYSDNCPDYTQCENRKCSIEKGFQGCYACEMDCQKGLLNKIKPYGFTLFIKR